MEEIKQILIKDNNYPKHLKEISNPPKILYYKGDIKSDELCFAIVGARQCSLYGKQVALEIAGNLAKKGITIVSGLAPGIDTFAHLGALEKGGKTIAVLASGLDQESFYPKQNIGLAKKIITGGGCLISQYPKGTKAAFFTFPERNRIISGLSLGTLVIEAKEKSGSLITANFAFSQKRKVFAVPGSIYSLNSKGTNSLIKKGAKLVDNYTDILQELKLTDLMLEKENIQENLKPEEKIILEALLEEPLFIDKIIEKTKLEAAKIASILTELEIKGRIRNLGGNIFAIAK